MNTDVVGIHKYRGQSIVTMCSLATECVLLLQNVLSYAAMGTDGARIHNYRGQSIVSTISSTRRSKP